MSLLRHHQLLMSSRRLGPDHDFGHTAFWPMQDTVPPMLSEDGAHNGSYFGAGTLLQQDGPHPTQKSVYFAGDTSSYGRINSHPDLNADLGEYAIEFWLRLIQPTSGVVGIVFGKFSLTVPFSGQTIFSNCFGVDLGGQYLLHGILYRDSAASGYFANTNPVTLPSADGVWRHYIFQRRNMGAGVWTLQCYVNGSFYNQITLPSVLNLSNTNQINIMGRGGQATKGYLSWLHWYKGKSFSATEAAAIYAARTNW